MCLLAVLALGLHCPYLRADTVVLASVADTTLIETAPDNNLGGALIVNAGTTQNYTRNRGLFRFDLASQIPRGSRIIKADFVLEVTGEPKDGFSPSSFGLHRVLKPWGEGDKRSPDPAHPGQGAPATTNEATWNVRFAFTQNAWTVPGGSATNDYAFNLSAEEQIYGLGDSPYTFASTSALVDDVQGWLDDPDTNFGWMLLCQAEQFNFTARRFGSREDSGHAPYLVVEYEPPKIDLVAVTSGRIDLSFTALANQPYTLEFSAGLSASNDWSALTNFPAQPAATNLAFSDPITSGQRFYRLRLP